MKIHNSHIQTLLYKDIIQRLKSSMWDWYYRQFFPILKNCKMLPYLYENYIFNIVIIYTPSKAMVTVFLAAQPAWELCTLFPAILLSGKCLLEKLALSCTWVTNNANIYVPSKRGPFSCCLWNATKEHQQDTPFYFIIAWNEKL